MLSLFNTSSETTGFRLQYMEIYNWGTFNDRVYRISPQGNNSLLTGANASGKSTLIDALLTLLVPTKKDRFYNQSSGIDKKGDRTEETYVLGNYGSIQREGESSTSTQRLRDKNTYSVILSCFSNFDSHITLFQVRWFSNGELKRSFGISREPLQIQKDFSSFDSKGIWKRELDKNYNKNTLKRRIEFFTGPSEYGERIWNLFGMRSEKGLSLFNQLVGVKVLDDLDEFIRANMLEARDAESEYVQLNSSFASFMEAKINIDKTKEQIELLKPINDLAVQLSDIQDRLLDLQESKEMGIYWFAQKSVELSQKHIEKLTEKLDELDQELVSLREKEEELKREERQLSISIETDQVGRQIEDLKKEIRNLENNKNKRSEKLEEYNKIAQKTNLLQNPNEKTFIENREKARTEKDNLASLIKEKNEELRQIKNQNDIIKKQIEENIMTIDVLKKTKNNISGREATIRDEILLEVGATPEEIPFIGELIRVKEGEKDWELSIEKILHNFALRLIVPSKYYTQVNQFVNSRNLNGRIVYQHYEGFTSLQEFENQTTIPNSLISKIEFKPKNKYTDWLEYIISNQYNYICVNKLEEFDRYKERAVTKEGLIKSIRGKHEKDDRPHILRKENYVLGWENKEKINLLQVEIRKWQEDQKLVFKQIRDVEQSIRETERFKEECFKLFEAFAKYDQIDWQSYAMQMHEKMKQKVELEKTNDKVKVLEEQLEQVRKTLKQLTEEVIKAKDTEIFQIRYKELENVQKIYTDNCNLLAQLGNINTLKFEQENIELLNLSFENIEQKQRDFKNKTESEVDKNKKQKEEKEREVAGLIINFKNPSEDITNRFKDWRSDVNYLPDAKNLNLIGEYQSFYKKLVEDDLIRFEKKYNEYLRETITNKISDFRRFFESWSESIKDNIRLLNDSLKEIDFKNNPSTYIQLVSPPKINDEVKEFRHLLEKALPNKREVDAIIDGRKNHFNDHILPLIEKLKNEQWRKRVMDVRAWFTYKAEEFYKETHQKYKTYESMGELSGGEKAQLTYTILGSAIAFQFGLTKEGLQSNSFRFIAIDEAFKAQDEDKSRYLISLCKQLHLQLLVVTPSDNIHIVENDISFVHYVERNEAESRLYDMPIQQFKEKQKKILVNDYSY